MIPNLSAVCGVEQWSWNWQAGVCVPLGSGNSVGAQWNKDCMLQQTLRGLEVCLSLACTEKAGHARKCLYCQRLSESGSWHPEGTAKTASHQWQGLASCLTTLGTHQETLWYETPSSSHSSTWRGEGCNRIYPCPYPTHYCNNLCAKCALWGIIWNLVINVLVKYTAILYEKL